MTVQPTRDQLREAAEGHLRYGGGGDDLAHGVLALLDQLAQAEAERDALLGNPTAPGMSAVRALADYIVTAERDTALAAIDRVRALHQPQTLTGLIGGDCADETCGHEDYCPTDSTAVVCAECNRVAEAGNPYYGENGLEASLYPCPTIRALDGEA